MEVSKSRYLTAFLLWLLPTMLWAAPPRVISSAPENGAERVPVDIGEVIIRFDRNMKMNSWSLMTAGELPFPPLRRGGSPWRDPKTLVIPLKRLELGTTYGIRLNSPSKKGFMAAKDQEPLPVTTLTFTTTDEEEQSVWSAKPATAVVTPQPPDTRGALSVPLGDLPVHPSAADMPTRPTASPRPRPGWRFQVDRDITLQGQAREDGEQYRIDYALHVGFVEEVVAAANGEVTEVTRTVRSASETEDGQVLGSIEKGRVFRVRFQDGDSLVYDEQTRRPVTDEDIEESFSWRLALPLWPDGALVAGQRWSYQGEDLARRLRALEVVNGRLDLRVERVAHERNSGLRTAYIAGHLDGRIPLDHRMLTFDAKVKIDLPLALGVPTRIEFDGRLRGGDPAVDLIDGQYLVRQIALPATAVVQEAKGDSVPPQPLPPENADKLRNQLKN